MIVQIEQDLICCEYLIDGSVAYQQNQIMPATIVYIDILSFYPFQTSRTHHNSNITFRARKIVPLSQEPRILLKEKINLLKKIGSQLLIELQSQIEDEHSFHLVYEYIRNSLLSSHRSGSEDLSDVIRLQLNVLASTLSENSIQHTFRLQNVGLDQKNNLKYYLGTDFVINKNIDKLKLMDRYFNQIDHILLQKINHKFEEEIRKTSHKDMYYYSLRTSQTVSKQKGIPKWMLRQSQIDYEDQLQTSMTKKPDKRIQITPSSNLQKSQTETEKQIFSRDNKKIGEIGARINKLKLCMKEVFHKTPPRSSSLVNLSLKYQKVHPERQNVVQNKKPHSPNYTKYEKKIAEFRESRLVKAEKDKQLQDCRFSSGITQDQMKKIQSKAYLIQDISQTLRQSQQGRIDGRLSYQVTKTTKPPSIKQPSSPKNQSRKYTQSFNSTGFEDERKVKQYMAMAQKDKYCEEFMYFLQEQNTESSLDNSKNTMQINDGGSKSNKDSSSLRIKINNPLNLAKKKYSENISTQCSQKGMAFLQSKVKNVISNSMKLITNLKSRESIPVQ